jgi:hypothetical protein
MDFNQIDIARDKCLGNNEDIWDQATVVPKSRGVFKEELTSFLPFRIVKHRISPVAFSYPTLRLDDCIIVTGNGASVNTFISDTL